MRFLVVEDNPRLQQVLTGRLAEQGYHADITGSGHDAEDMSVKNVYNGIILDIMLPDSDGVQVCKNLRRLGVSSPILMLTALGGTDDKVNGLDAGADDYLTKPFEPGEFDARIRALMRRTHASEGSRLRYDDIEMDLLRHHVTRRDEPIKLTAKEFSLLECFMRNPDRVLSRSTLGERVWDLCHEDESNVIEVYVSRLRAKIDKAFDKPMIHTVIGLGYVLSADGPPA